MQTRSKLLTFPHSPISLLGEELGRYCLEKTMKKKGYIIQKRVWQNTNEAVVYLTREGAEKFAKALYGKLPKSSWRVVVSKQ